MNSSLNTGYNRSFEWIETAHVRFIGYLLGSKKLIPDKNTLARIFEDCTDFISFCKIVKELNGVFSIIFQSGDDIYAASDSTRFFPIFYTHKNDILYLSDDIDFVRSKTGSAEMDNTAVAEYLASAFTCENRTLFKYVKQIMPAEAISFSQKIPESVSLFSMGKTYKELRDDSLESLTEDIKKHLDSAFTKTLLPLKDKPILLPLSGGIDSRLIACKLKELGFTNVLCFTYGRRNHEVEISRRVAEKLDFKWLFIEYTQELIEDYHRHELFDQYYKYASRGTSMFYLQEYPAIKWLIEKGIVNSDYIVLPGHPGDLVRGALILSKNPMETDTSRLPELLLKRKFIHAKYSSTEEDILSASLSNSINRLQTDTNLLAYSVQEDWELKERTSKYIINSSHAFTFFGLQCYFPLADTDLLKLFRVLPLKFRRHGALYKKILYTYYFEPGNLDFRDDIQPSLLNYIIDKLKKRIRPILPLSIRARLLHKNDWANYGPMTDFMLEELHEQGIHPIETGSSHLYRILNWYLMKLRRD